MLPTNTLWNSNHELIGYKMPFISGKRNIKYDSIYTLLEELEVLKQDLDLLCNNLIILRDINLSNTIYNGHIYLIDPGSYLIDELDKIIFNVNIDDSSITEKLDKIIIDGDYSKIKILTESLTLKEKQNLLRK